MLNMFNEITDVNKQASDGLLMAVHYVSVRRM